ncbi:MFS transporter [Rhodococcus jostii]|uniref:Major Facilitator Superfamily protein n=1 Tax=Rhodococcus jostii TaxID=132919 RepID=A0A1H5FC22_RHOJO|nr:MFS transporter [Rhodococcus jostii]SEE00754.1 Major Facilitator Superfamily protein [Rhodococcus jostii]
MSTTPHTGTRRATGSSAAVGFLIVMEFGSGLLQGWYPPLLTTIGQEHAASAAALNWVNAIFLLASVACVPIIAKLGDMYGHRRMLVASAAAVAVGSFVVAFAPSFAVLLVGRALQAPLIAFLPLEFAIVRHRDPERAGRNIGRLIGALTGGVIVGGFLAGWFISSIENLTVVLLVPGIMLALCVPVAHFLVQETTVRKAGSIDWAGAALLSTGMLMLLGGVSNGNAIGWTSPLIVALVAGGVVALASFVIVENRAANPLIDFRVMRRGRLVLPVLIAALLGAQSFGSQAPISLFSRTDPTTYGYGLGVTATVAGLLLSITATGAFIASTISDRIARTFTPRYAVVFGALTSAAAYIAMILVHDDVLAFSIWLFLLGVGVGTLAGVVPSIIVNRAPEDAVGIASGIYNSSRTGAGSIAGAMFALIMSSLVTTMTVGEKTTSISSFTAYAAVWAICATLCIVIAAAAPFLDPRRPRSACAIAVLPAGENEPAPA